MLVKKEGKKLEPNFGRIFDKIKEINIKLKKYIKIEKQNIP